MKIPETLDIPDYAADVVAGTSPEGTLKNNLDSEREQKRLESLFSMLPAQAESVIDIGAREGYISLQLAKRYDAVTALDLTRPRIENPFVTCVAGDVTRLDFPDGSFDLALCAEVLEHIPPAGLPKACAEIARVTRRHAFIGVPYRQDTRLGRTVCAACKGKNPPWGHVNVFDEKRLHGLFPGMRPERTALVGGTRERTSALAALLMDLAGNPYGTYEQEEACVHCGAKLSRPEGRNLARRAAGWAGHRLNRLQARLAAPRPIWIHILFSKPPR